MVGGPPPPSWLVLGARGHARVVADVVGRSGGVVAAVCGSPDEHPWPVPVLADDDEAFGYAAQRGLLVAMGVGANDARLALLERAVTAGLAVPTLLAVTSTTAPDAVLGEGSAILEHAHVGPSVHLGRGVIVNTAAVVEHDCSVADGVHVSPGAVLLGGARVGAGTLVGSGARVLPGVSVGAACVVGAGAVVRSDVPDGWTVAGVPAVPVSR